MKQVSFECCVKERWNNNLEGLMRLKIGDGGKGKMTSTEHARVEVLHSRD